ncbi:glycerophosphodiester phosphodiesterase family protein [Pararhizobium haloflavum]|uniref:glycerophosphodiester phosphodiesterase family protein n=1 Tax=Pararhizobium haloflavum TaxID=2037914 RepID=UPI000C1A2A3D|nr:glycerophosphodiester phosphodiesterase family protein [Pararhizobium haloflavum]
MRDTTWLTRHPIAHRGYHDLNTSVFENTLAAFQRAADAGFSIECDLQFAADAVPVVFHDDTLERLCALKLRTRDKLSSELQQTAVGGTRERIPTLADMLKTVRGRVPLVIELKGQPGDDDGFAGAVLETLEGYAGPVALMSFDHALLRDLKELEAPYLLGLTAEGVREEALAGHEKAWQIGLDFVSYNVHHLPNAFVARLRETGTPVISWTVRNQEARDRSFEFADQMTFEGFDPRPM